MISRLPRWVEIGGGLLALVAGAVNAVGLLGFEHQAVSHLTGTSTLLGVEVTHARWDRVWHLGLVLVCFVVGAAIANLVVKDTALELGRRYSLALLIESVLFLCAAVTLNADYAVGHLLASAACGLQNGMASTFSGAVVRTTHVSGMFTDLGLMLGARLRGVPSDPRRAQLYGILISGFTAGGVIGALLFARLGYSALMVPAVVTALMSAVSYAHTRATRPV